MNIGSVCIGFLNMGFVNIGFVTIGLLNIAPSMPMPRLVANCMYSTPRERRYCLYCAPELLV